MIRNQTIIGITDQLEVISKELTDSKPSPIYATVRFEKDSKTVVLAANEEGLIYFASILLSLAKGHTEHSHFHFDSGTVLDSPDLNLVIKHERASWENQ